MLPFDESSTAFTSLLAAAMEEDGIWLTKGPSGFGSARSAGSLRLKYLKRDMARLAFQGTSEDKSTKITNNDSFKSTTQRKYETDGDRHRGIIVGLREWGF